jgi:hypothetical protein
MATEIPDPEPPNADLGPAGASESHRRHHFRVPYGELMTSRDHAEIHLGEEDAVVLERLVESGRPEKLVEPYVLVLFPPAEEDVY